MIVRIKKSIMLEKKEMRGERERERETSECAKYDGKVI